MAFRFLRSRSKIDQSVAVRRQLSSIIIRKSTVARAVGARIGIKARPQTVNVPLVVVIVSKGHGLAAERKEVDIHAAERGGRRVRRSKIGADRFMRQRRAGGGRALPAIGGDPLALLIQVPARSRS